MHLHIYVPSMGNNLVVKVHYGLVVGTVSQEQGCPRATWNLKEAEAKS